MLVDIGNNEYRNLVELEDFIDIISSKISHEFGKYINNIVVDRESDFYKKYNIAIEELHDGEVEIEYLRNSIESAIECLYNLSNNNDIPDSALNEIKNIIKRLESNW